MLPVDLDSPPQGVALHLGQGAEVPAGEERVPNIWHRPLDPGFGPRRQLHPIPTIATAKCGSRTGSIRCMGGSTSLSFIGRTGVRTGSTCVTRTESCSRF